MEISVGAEADESGRTKCLPPENRAVRGAEPGASAEMSVAVGDGLTDMTKDILVLGVGLMAAKTAAREERRMIVARAGSPAWSRNGDRRQGRCR